MINASCFMIHDYLNHHDRAAVLPKKRPHPRQQLSANPKQSLQKHPRGYHIVVGLLVGYPHHARTGARYLRRNVSSDPPVIYTIFIRYLYDIYTIFIRILNDFYKFISRERTALTKQNEFLPNKAGLFKLRNDLCVRFTLGRPSGSFLPAGTLPGRAATPAAHRNHIPRR